jgi:hypothetical protein
MRGRQSGNWVPSNELQADHCPILLNALFEEKYRPSADPDKSRIDRFLDPPNAGHLFDRPTDGRVSSAGHGPIASGSVHGVPA